MLWNKIPESQPLRRLTLPEVLLHELQRRLVARYGNAVDRLDERHPAVFAMLMIERDVLIFPCIPDEDRRHIHIIVRRRLELIELARIIQFDLLNARLLPNFP